MPREGHDDAERAKVFGNRSFQSTCPARGTTLVLSVSLLLDVHFNPRAPRGARPRVAVYLYAWQYYFNPRAPRGARRKCRGCRLDYARISIHVPREGHDSHRTETLDRRDLFQSTCPARGTTIAGTGNAIIAEFQSTCPARGTTNNESGDQHGEKISIHVPREGHDVLSENIETKNLLFQSTCPARGTTRFTGQYSPICLFQSTCPARGTTLLSALTPLRVC